MNAKILISAVALFAMVGACTSPREQALNRQSRAAERTLERLGSVGDPGSVAAADFAFARMAREEGQWTAFAATAAPGALIHGENGPIEAAPWLAALDDPEESVVWGPNTVWSSCDGTLAVTFGRFQDTEGLVGNYVTAWELQSDGSYKWIYDIGAQDNPQPTPIEEPDIPEDAIIVPGLTAINGMVADCPRVGEAQPEIAVQLMPMAESGGRFSADRTLRWDWFHTASGERSVIVNWVRDGEVQRALFWTAPPALED
ncbi:hypothetical protein [Aurantiacibacter sediminis]|uniref:DUF4440 domain-containing protein n=1 Tax=Aurantiacibacter sediminis TaxID=2793064 RepID=A0ABS0MZI1_9SPHN|nr:hypothetical protein [Aurantiacibacter sediminis]MBH5321112.1 hypothetical protein [Aurantiacibacter sediminis]